MIVISGVLVLVALILLVLGVTMQELDFVYASIVVSLVSLVFLVIGILQRRRSGSGPTPVRTPVSAPTGGSERPAPRAEVTTVAPAPAASAVPRTSKLSGVPGKGKSMPPAAAPVAPAAADETVPDEAIEGGIVLVMSGRPRYHVDGCRYLSSKIAEEMDVVEAREEGFTPCGVCKPDQALLEAIEAGDWEDEPVEDERFQDEPVEDERVEEPVAAIAPAGRSRKSATTRVPADLPGSPSKAAGAGAALSGAALSGATLAKTPGAKTRFAKGAPAPAAEDAMPKTRKTPKTEAGPAESAGVTSPGTTARGRGTGKGTPTVAAPGEASESRSVSRGSSPSKQPAPPAPPKRAAGVPAKPGAAKLVTKQGASKVSSSGGAEGDTSGGSISGEAALNSPTSTDVSPRAKRGGPELAETSGPSPVAMKPGSPPRKPAAAAAAGPGAAGAGTASRPRRAGSVVVVPGRPRFHKPGCRFVRDAQDAESLTANQAAKKGYTACGACKPD